MNAIRSRMMKAACRPQWDSKSGIRVICGGELVFVPKMLMSPTLTPQPLKR